MRVPMNAPLAIRRRDSSLGCVVAACIGSMASFRMTWAGVAACIGSVASFRMTGAVNLKGSDRTDETRVSEIFSDPILS